MTTDAAQTELAGNGEFLAGLMNQLALQGKIEQVRIDDLDLQHRVRVSHNRNHVRALADSEGEMPPVIVQRSTLRVIDGVHRVRARMAIGEEYIDAVMFDGGDYECLVLAVRLNTRHGLPLSRAERITALNQILRESPHWSDRSIAELAGVSAKTVASRRIAASAELPQLTRRLGRDGRVRPLDPHAGRAAARGLIQENPALSVRQIASMAGLSPATVRDEKRRMTDTAATTGLAIAFDTGRLAGGTVDEPGRRHVADRVDDVAPAAGPAPEEPARNGTPALQGTPAPESAQQHSPPVDALLQQLRSDPSLRFSDAGRLVLRQFSVTASIGPRGWSRLAEAIPQHCRAAVATAAQHSAASLLTFADELARDDHG